MTLMLSGQKEEGGPGKEHSEGEQEKHPHQGPQKLVEIIMPRSC